MAIRRYEVAKAIPVKGRGARRSVPGGTGTVLVRVDIEPTRAVRREEVVAAIEAIAKQVAAERWPMQRWPDAS